MSSLVAVRVDAEDSRERDGFSGPELALRYGVRGFPANLLIDGEGRVLARADGYLSPGQLLSWIDRSVGRPVATPVALAR
jgi:thioredoxin-related protein